MKPVQTLLGAGAILAVSTFSVAAGCCIDPSKRVTETFSSSSFSGLMSKARSCPNVGVAFSNSRGPQVVGSRAAIAALGGKIEAQKICTRALRQRAPGN